MNNLFSLGLFFCALFFSQFSHSALIDLGYPSGVGMVDGMLYHKFGDRKPTIIYPDLEKPSLRDVTRRLIPSSKGRQPVEVVTKAKVFMPKVGKALTNLAKRLGPISVALAVRDLVCDLSDICVSPDSGQTFQKRIPGQPQFKNKTTTYYIGPVSSEEPLDVCERAKAYYCDSDPSKCGPPSIETQSNGLLACSSYNSKGYTQTGTLQTTVACSPGYFSVGDQCEAYPETLNTRYRPITEQDWTDAEPKLSVPQAVPHLVDAREPLVVGVPEIEPFERPIDESETTHRDGTGNATGTEKRTTTLKGEPTGQPNEIRTIERTITTITNVTNNTTNTTTTDTKTPDEPPEDDLQIEFDKVNDQPDLEEHEMEKDFNTDSWGGGSCPADPTVSYSKGTLTLPFHVACDYAILLHSVVLLLAGITAAFIIVGGKNGDS